MVSSQPAVCPFCAIHCDDIVLGKTGNTECSKAVIGFEGLVNSPPVARLGGNQVTTQAILDYGRGLFANRDYLNVATAGTDFPTAKTLEELVSLGRVKLWIDETISEAAWRRATSREGHVSATIGDIRSHADVIWVVGNIMSSYPRLLQRMEAAKKRVVTSEVVDAETLAEWFYRLRQSATDEQDDHIGTIRNASYLAILIGPDAFAPSEAISAATLLAKMLWFLNQDRRAVTLQIDCAATNRSLTAWRTNRGLVSINDAMLCGQTIDVRLGSETMDKRKADIQIGGVDRGERVAEAYLPSATAGIDTTAMVIRGDSTVSLSLEQHRETSNQTTSELLEKLLDVMD